MAPNKFKLLAKKEKNLEQILEEINERKSVESPKKKVKHITRKKVNPKALMEKLLTSEAKRKLLSGFESSEQEPRSWVQGKGKGKVSKLEEFKHERVSDDEGNHYEVK